MSTIITAIFNNYTFAENAAKQIKEQGFNTNDISIIAKEPTSNEFSMKSEKNDNISDGVVTGSVLGGVAGLLIGAGSMVIPGLGMIAAAGPVVGILSGALTGGIVGGLVDLGIPEGRSKEYEKHVKLGKVLFNMKTEDQSIPQISGILKTNGAISIDTY